MHLTIRPLQRKQIQDTIKKVEDWTNKISKTKTVLILFSLSTSRNRSGWPCNCGHCNSFWSHTRHTEATPAAGSCGSKNHKEAFTYEVCWNQNTNILSQIYTRHHETCGRVCSHVQDNSLQNKKTHAWQDSKHVTPNIHRSHKDNTCQRSWRRQQMWSHWKNVKSTRSLYRQKGE